MIAYSYLTLKSGWDSLEDNPFMLEKITSYILEKGIYLQHHWH